MTTGLRREVLRSVSIKQVRAPVGALVPGARSCPHLPAFDTRSFHCVPDTVSVPGDAPLKSKSEIPFLKPVCGWVWVGRVGRVMRGGQTEHKTVRKTYGMLDGRDSGGEKYTNGGRCRRVIEKMTCDGKEKEGRLSLSVMEEHCRRRAWA